MRRWAKRIGIALGILGALYISLGCALTLVVRGCPPELGCFASLGAGLMRFRPAERALIAALDSGSEEGVSGAALGLGLMRSRRSVPALIDHLGPADLDTRFDIAAGLIMIRDPSSVPGLIRLASMKGGLVSSPRFARHALARITGSPDLQVFAHQSSEWDDTDEGGRLLTEDEQIEIFKNWWAAHGHEYEETGQ